MTGGSPLHEVLDELDDEQLRTLIHRLIRVAGPRVGARLQAETLAFAARVAPEYVPAGPDEARIVGIEAFAEEAQDQGYAQPWEVDAALRDGQSAFRARDYAGARRVFQALLIPLSEGEIDLGQEEMIEEVLDVEVGECVRQLAVATWMTATPEHRLREVSEAIALIQSLDYCPHPLKDLESAALEPLPGFEGFVEDWRSALETRLAARARRDSGSREEAWLREAVDRSTGLDGLAALARGSRRADDLEAWCEGLLAAGDWSAARAAFAEAATLVVDEAHRRGDFLDGAALAAQELGADDLDLALEAAWREEPTLARLRRWLGLCRTRSALLDRASAALGALPAREARQRAFLRVLTGDLAEAARDLRGADGDTWLFPDHPGHLIAPLLIAALQGAALTVTLGAFQGDIVVEKRLHLPSLDQLLGLAEVPPLRDDGERLEVALALRATAEARVEAVMTRKRRDDYAHAAQLSVECARADGSPEGRAWLEAVKRRCRRFPALKRAFQEAEGAA